MRDLQIEYRPLSSLKPYADNARTHSEPQIRKLVASIREYGFTNPILVDENAQIIAGHGRHRAAERLKLETVPVVQLAGLTEAQRKALRLADNRIAENAGWDRDKLRIELCSIMEIEGDFDISLTGFEMAEVDQIVLADGKDEGPDAADVIPCADPEAPTITQPGDLWSLGPHRVLCGDSTKADSYVQLMDGKRAQMVFTDPPYNVPIDGHVSGLGSIKHREFAMGVGEMSEEEFLAFLKTVLGHLASNSVDGSIHYVCMDWAHLYELLTACRAAYTEQKNLCVWNKTNGGMGSLYRSKHELIAVFKNGKKPHINNVELGKHGRYRTNVWDCAGISSLGPDRAETLALHPTVKPVTLVADAILDCSRRQGIILDPFLGSGTTLMAAERTGRVCYGIEMDPAYVDTIIRRWEGYTGETGETGERL